MDVFNAFPNAIISNQWELGEVQYATEIGTQFANPKPCDVILDEGSFTARQKSPEIAYEDSDDLIYAKPEQMPTLVTAKLTNGYMWHDKLNDLYYEIRDASIGKNQETGEIEHIEFLIRPTEVASNGGSSL
ncbi:MAG: hypothetical protein NC548_27200 [Lachnospiraceae bacterium]|nr:hypothetical protein [Lachnospiraceae bacterium]